jgi:nicotinamide mononucleotide transporter
MDILSTGTIAFIMLGYPLSFIEITATIFGLISVYLASRGNILTWPAGLVNEICFLIIFFQVQLYADMLLQVYFFVVTIYGWVYWRSQQQSHSISRVSSQYRVVILVAIFSGTALLGFIMGNIHHWAPTIVQLPAAYPYIDSFTTVVSIVAMILLAQKKLETWVLWIIVDVVCVGLYWIKGIHLISIQYLVFLFIAAYGFFNWRSQFGK